jgi:hypothetical protein
MAREPSSAPKAKGIQEEMMQVYKETCMNIRESDSISFKILGLVPTLSVLGSTALTFFKETLKVDQYWISIVLLSLLGAVITLGLYRWELRNIQTCKWLITRAAKMEEELLPHQISGHVFAGYASAGSSNFLDRDKIPLKPNWKKSTWGKTESASLVYLAAATVWLVPLIQYLIQLCVVY